MALDHLPKNWRLQEELIYTCYQCSRVYQDWITCNTLIQYLHVPFSFEVLMVKIAPTQVSTTLQKKSPKQNFSSPPTGENFSPTIWKIMIYAISAPDCIPLVVLKGRVGYISTSLFCMSKRQHIWNKEKCFLFHKSFLLLRKPNFRIIDIQVSWCHRQTRFRLKKTCKNGWICSWGKTIF